ncbi:MAG: NUDIX domain-containing protein [Acidimicrobiia bacterium]|nr:NUDIX domain-containing protein [Acidimicrobiia bacterium]
MNAQPDERPSLEYVHVADVVVRHPETGDLALVERSDGTWWLPGGRVEVNETFVDAAVREVGEETGMRVRIDGVVAVSERIEPDRHVVFVTCAATWLAGSPEVPGSDPKIVGAAWVDAERAQALLPSFAVTSAILDPAGVVPHFAEEAL